MRDAEAVIGLSCAGAGMSLGMALMAGASVWRTS